MLGMPTSMGQQDFEFIVSSGPRLPPDAALRTLIRKQAMKNAGIRRRARGNHNHATSMQDSVQDERTHGPEQPIVTGGYSGDESSSSSSVSTTASPATLESDLEEVAFPNETARLDPAVQVLRTVKSYRITSSHLAINPSEGYEAMRAKYNFDVKDLCFLTNFNIGRSTIAAMAQNPVLLATLLGHQTESYLCHLPGRYGHKPYLTAAIECVTVKAQSMLHPSDTTFSATALRKYAKALRAVQKAVQDDEASLDADLLCAVQMLSLHEVRCLSLRTKMTVHLMSTMTGSRPTTDYSIRSPCRGLRESDCTPLAHELHHSIRTDALPSPHWPCFFRGFVQETAMLPCPIPLDQVLGIAR